MGDLLLRVHVNFLSLTYSKIWLMFFFFSKPFSRSISMLNIYSICGLFYVFMFASFPFTHPLAPLPSPCVFIFLPHGSSGFLSFHLRMNEENAMAREEIKISLFTALEFGNAISICTARPRDIYCFGLSFLYCDVSFIPSRSL